MKDLLIRLGKVSYPTIDHFIAEARAKGVCERISSVPSFLNSESKCYLLHRNNRERVRCFGWFTIGQIAVCIDEAKLPSLQTICGTKLAFCPRSDFPAGERECGEMVPGGIYMVSKSVFDIAKRTAKETDICDDLHTFDKPYPYLQPTFPHFRGYRYIDGEEFLASLKFPRWCKTKPL